MLGRVRRGMCRLIEFHASRLYNCTSVSQSLGCTTMIVLSNFATVLSGLSHNTHLNRQYSHLNHHHAEMPLAHGAAAALAGSSHTDVSEAGSYLATSDKVIFMRPSCIFYYRVSIQKHAGGGEGGNENDFTAHGYLVPVLSPVLVRPLPNPLHKHRTGLGPTRGPSSGL